MKDTPNNKLGAAPITRGVLAAACAVALCALASASHARNVGSLGGSGGQEFRSECNPNDVIIGFNIRSGNALDAIVPICIPLNAQRTEWAGQAYEPTRYFGGGGGTYSKVACQPGDAVRHIGVVWGPWGDTQVVRGFGIECWDLEGGSSYWLDANISYSSLTRFRVVVGRDRLTCGNGEWATGIFGRSGALVDQLGLVCDTIEAAKAPPSKPADPVLVPTPSTGPSPFGDAPSKPATPPPTTASAGTCKVVLDTQVYDKPDGEGASIDVLNAPRDVPPGQKKIFRLYALAEPCRDNWCHLKGSGVPTGDGWVYSGPDHRSLKCS